MNQIRMKKMENFLAYFIAVIHFGIKYECKCYWYKDLRNPRNNRKLDGSYDPKESGRSKILIDDHLMKRPLRAAKTLFHEGIHHAFLLRGKISDEDMTLQFEEMCWSLMSQKQKHFFIKLIPKKYHPISRKYSKKPRS